MFKRKWHKFVLIGALLPIVLFIAWELGSSVIHSYNASFHSDSHWHENRENITYYSTYALPGSPQTAITATATTSGRDARLVAESLTSNLRENQFLGTATVTVDEWTLENFGWRPLQKKGTLKYKVSFVASVRKDQKQVNVTGNVTGTLDCTVSGYCGYFGYRAVVAREIGNQLAEKLKEDLNQ